MVGGGAILHESRVIRAAQNHEHNHVSKCPGICWFMDLHLQCGSL